MKLQYWSCCMHKIVILTGHLQQPSIFQCFFFMHEHISFLYVLLAMTQSWFLQSESESSHNLCQLLPSYHCTLFKQVLTWASIHDVLMWMLTKWCIAAGISMWVHESHQPVQEKDKWWVQYPIIHAAFLPLTCCNSLSHYVLAWYRQKKNSEANDPFFQIPGLVLQWCFLEL